MAIAKRAREFIYVLAEERKLPAEQQTRWRLKTLSYTEAEELEERDYLIDPAEGTRLSVNGMKKARLALNAGLLGWENFRDESGAEVPFREGKSDMRRVVPDEVLDLIRPTWAMELADAIRNEANLDLAASKNC